MSPLDLAKLAEVISLPADSFVFNEKAAVDNFGLPHRKYMWRWGKPTDPNRVTILIMTANEPIREDDGSLTVYYEPVTCVIMTNDQRPSDRYVGVGMYSFNYDEEKPELVRNLADALWPLSHPVCSAPCVAGI